MPSLLVNRLKRAKQVNSWAFPSISASTIDAKFWLSARALPTDVFQASCHCIQRLTNALHSIQRAGDNWLGLVDKEIPEVDSFIRIRDKIAENYAKHIGSMVKLIDIPQEVKDASHSRIKPKKIGATVPEVGNNNNATL